MSDLIEHNTKLHERKYGDGGSYWIFYCPGCKRAHSIPVGRPRGPNWTFNGDTNNPTFAPSLKMTCNDTPDKSDRTVCHLFVRSGQIEFCGDCPHELIGKTVPMVEIPGNYQT
jgi:hypothetical protein